MMMVVAMILIVASISAPIYQTVTRRTRETVLRDHLYTLRSLINRFTLDNQRPPASLEELVEKGYLGRLPTDPFTGSNQTWREDVQDTSVSPEVPVQGVVDAGGAYVPQFGMYAARPCCRMDAKSCRMAQCLGSG